MSRKIVIAATPTSPLVQNLLHKFQHEANLSIAVLTRSTSITVTSSDTHAHNGTTNGHHHTSKVTHIQTDFSSPELKNHLGGVDTVICVLTGPDLHLSGPLIDAASEAGVKLFVPSEYGLDTSNSKIREFLPPYRTRFEIREILKSTDMGWKAIYCGIGLVEGMKTDGVMGIDALWGSVVVFPGAENVKVAISTTEYVAKSIVQVVCGKHDEKRNEVYVCGFRCTLEQIIGVVEKELDRSIDRYEGDLECSEREAKERMNMGYFDGGVALMGRVAVWGQGVDAWGGWKENQETGEGDWEEEVKRVVREIRSGEIGGDGCSC